MVEKSRLDTSETPNFVVMSEREEKQPAINVGYNHVILSLFIPINFGKMATNPPTNVNNINPTLEKENDSRNKNKEAT